jgi:predicted transcriptional regulator
LHVKTKSVIFAKKTDTIMATPQIAGDSRRIVHANRAQEEIPFERIPGLAYTHEERVAAALEALEDYRAGRCISHEEMGKRIASW